MKAYSMDLRRRTLRMCDAGRTTREVARAFDVSESWIRKLKQRRREDNTVGPRSSGAWQGYCLWGISSECAENRRGGLAFEFARQ